MIIRDQPELKNIKLALTTDVQQQRLNPKIESPLKKLKLSSKSSPQETDAVFPSKLHNF